MDYEFFAARLKWLRESHGLTQKDVADELGVSQPYYGKFEKATGQPNLETLVKLPKIFHESLDFICGVELLDGFATRQLQQYCDLRFKTEAAKKRINVSLELLESTNIENSLEHKLDILVKKKVSFDRYDERLKRTQNDLITYMSYLPGLEHIIMHAEQEYLDKKYHEFLVEYQDDHLDL